MQLSGGQLLPPIQKLVATIQFAKGKLVIESLILCQKTPDRLSGRAFFSIRIGIRKGGTSARTGATKCPVDTLLARGRIHDPVDISGTDVDTGSFGL